MVDVMDKLQKISNIGKSVRDMQKEINVSEVFYIWDIMVTKLDLLTTLNILDNHIESTDLKIIANKYKDGLVSGINHMEELMKKYGIPFPLRPPADSNSTVNIEYFSDRLIFEEIYAGIQSFFPVLSSGFMNCTSPEVRKVIKTHLMITMELQEAIVEYGKLKGFLDMPPIYRE